MLQKPTSFLVLKITRNLLEPDRKLQISTPVMKFKYLVPAFAWALLIMLATSIPASYIPSSLQTGIKNLDKVVHFFMFAVFGFLLVRAFRKQPPEIAASRHSVVFAITLGFLFGLLTEGLQHFFFASRSGELLDVASNLFGTIFGVYICVKVFGCRKKNSKKTPKKLA